MIPAEKQFSLTAPLSKLISILPVLLASLAMIAPVTNAQTITNSANCHSYFLTPTTSSWSNAEAYAVSAGGHLATVRSAQEQAWIVSTFLSGTNSRRLLWIGLTDVASKGKFKWVSGDPLTFTKWTPDEPNNSTKCGAAGEHWVTMNWEYGNHIEPSVPGEWNDEPVNGVKPGCGPQPCLGLVEIASQPLTITTHPANAIASTRAVIFNVAASGPGPLTYQWRRRSNATNEWTNLANATTDTLTIANAQAGDIGEYDCLVSNGCNPAGVPSNPATLSAAPMEKKITSASSAKPGLFQRIAPLLLTIILAIILEVAFASLINLYIVRGSMGATPAPVGKVMLIHIHVCLALFMAATGIAFTLATIFHSESIMAFARSFTGTNCLAAGCLVIFYFIKEAVAKPDK